MKNNSTVAMCIMSVVISFSLCTIFYTKFNDGLNSIETKLIEIDGRRNAQYGIMKRSLEQCRRVE